MTLLDRLRGREEDRSCRCDPSIRTAVDADGDRGVSLVVDAGDCPGGGNLVESPACRETVVDALTDRDVDAVRTRTGGLERAYDDAAVALLVATGRFVDAVAVHDERVADRARRDPLGAAHEATGRAGPVNDVAATTGLATCAARVEGGYETALRASVGPTVADSRLATRPPEGATLVDRYDLDTGARVRRYETPSADYYDLEPVEARFDEAALSTLSAAYDRLAAGDVDGGDRAASRAVRRVVEDGAVDVDEVPVGSVARVLRKHTRGHGVLDDLFADPRVAEVVVTAPVGANPVRVAADGDRLPTNVHLTDAGAAALASRFRRTSGRAFSRANPTLDATVDGPDGRRIRVAGVADPASDGYGFAFRAHDRRAWTLPALVANGTLSADAAALCSVAVERAAAGLVAGPRGAGKTTLLSALLWELPPATRTVLVEDTPELPAAALRDEGRDVQSVRVETDDGPSLSPTEALRTALRLGEGALVVGEVRGEEAATLYEAMRVGAAESAVLGTIHGDGAEAVFERVVTDLGVPASSFAATDLLVTCTVGDRRRVASVEEVRRVDGDPPVAFETLFELGDDGLEPTGVVERGNSRLVADLALPGESYADVLSRVESRASSLADLARTERVDPSEVTDAYRARAGGPR